MTTRRDAISFGVSSLLLGSLADADDRCLIKLVEEHHRFDKEILLAEDEADVLLSASRRSGRGRSAAAETACAGVEALHEAQGRVANAIINTPASTLVGAAYKLVVWRREAAISYPDDFDGAHESFTFSAYRDLLRLAGLGVLEHPHDQATLARMRRYWIPP